MGMRNPMATPVINAWMNKTLKEDDIGILYTLVMIYRLFLQAGNPSAQYLEPSIKRELQLMQPLESLRSKIFDSCRAGSNLKRQKPIG